MMAVEIRGFMPSSSLQSRQKTRAVFSVLLFFVIGVGIPLVLIFGTGLWRVFEEPLTLKNGLLLLCVLVVPPSFAIGFVNRQSRRFAAESFDPFFDFLKLESGSYLRGRQYHGEWEGRRLDIYLHPLQRQHYVPLVTGSPLRVQTYDGHMLEIFMEVSLGTHFASVSGTRISAMKGVSRASDAEWAKEVLSSKPVSKSIQALTALGNKVPMVTVEGLPNALLFKIHLSKTLISKEAIETWLEELCGLVEALENSRKPEPREVENKWERWSRLDRNKLHAMAKGGCLVALILLLGGIGALVEQLS